jgi:hypothetical protein
MRNYVIFTKKIANIQFFVGFSIIFVYLNYGGFYENFWELLILVTKPYPNTI